MGTELAGPEGMRVYRLALEVAAAVDRIVRFIPLDPLAGQLSRAADSIVLNIAEGAAHWTPGRKIMHYRYAHGSTNEIIAALTRLHNRTPAPLLASTRRDANMICIMLSALIRTQERRRKD